MVVREAGLSPAKRALLERWKRSAPPEASSPPSPTIARRAEPGPAPLSSPQQRLWFLNQLEPGSRSYNLHALVRLSGRLDRQALALSFREIARRHEILRTVFRSEADRPVQVVLPQVELALPRIDHSGLPVELRPLEALAWTQQEAGRSFDLACVPMRALLLENDESEHVLLVVLHHIIWDGWSVGVFLRELAALYEAFAHGVPSPLAPLSLQYADFAVWQQEGLAAGAYAADLAYWRQQLHGAADLELPSDHPRPALRTFRGASCPVELEPLATQALAALARRHQATLFMALLAIFQTLLLRYTETADLAVGTPVGGRGRKELEPLLGLFLNILVLRCDLSGDPGFGDLLDRVRRTALDAYDHQDLPFERLVEELQPERERGRNPFFQVMFALQNAALPEIALSGLTLREEELPSRAAMFDLALSLRQRDGAISGSLEYSSDLFEAATAQRLLAHLTCLLAGAAATPERRLSELPLLTAEERRQLLAWNDRAAPLRHDACLHHLFEAWAAEIPDAPAVVCGERTLSYGELDRRANRLARHLRRLGVGPEVPVVLWAGRSPEMVVGILGILKAGGAYVPCDESYPRERLAMMTEDAHAPVLIIQREKEPGEKEGREEEDRMLRETAANGVAVVSLEAAWGLSAREDDDGPADARHLDATPDGIAYVIFTSGSTGRPKGVACTHLAALNLLADMERRRPLAPGESCGLWTSISFDVSVWEIFSALCYGGVLCIAMEEERTSAEPFFPWLARHSVRSAFVPTFLLAELAEWVQGGPERRSLARLLVGVEPIRERLLTRILLAHQGLRIVNGYGPTEATVCASFYDVGAGPVAERRTPLGLPVANGRIHLRDRHCQEVPVGVPGEVWIGGAGLARGYFGRPELTAERFVPDPAAGAGAPPGARCYRSGDLARRHPNGHLEFLGRRDQQVKVRGWRIELGEIEAVLSRHPGVWNAVAAVREDPRGDQHLVAYVVPREQSSDADSWRDFLARHLPAPMLPSRFISLPALPLAPSGKVDRHALPEPDWQRSHFAPYRTAGDPQQEGGRTAPRSQVEELVVGIWEEILSVDRVESGDNFFALGGHSLLATRVMARLRMALEIDLPLGLLFEQPTPARLARAVETALSTFRTLALPRLQPSAQTGRLPASFAQERLWLIHQLDPGSPAYNVAGAFRLRGVLDRAVLAAGLREIVSRHAALRTTFVFQERLLQRVAPVLAPPLPLVDLGALAGGAGDREARRLMAAEAWRGFDLGTGPLLRATLVRRTELEHLALISLHHIVADGWSLGVLVREIGEIYRACAEGGPARLPALPIQYTDFALWQREWLAGPVLAGEIAYWREDLAGLEPLALPTDRSRPRQQPGRAGLHPFVLPAAATAALVRLARARGATLFMALLGGLEALFVRLSGQEDLAVGTPVANRTRPEVEALIGFFVNTLVLRCNLAEDPSFGEILERVRRSALSAFAHQNLPFEKLVEELAPRRDSGRTPLFQVLFTLQNTDRVNLALPGLNLDTLVAPPGVAKVDLQLNLTETAVGVVGWWEYDRDLFDPPTVARISGHLASLLAAAARSPELRLSQLPLLSAPELHQVSREWNDSGAAFPDEVPIHHLFERVAARRAEAIAVVDGSASLSYGALAARASRLARVLRRTGVGPEVTVGICSRRLSPLVVGLLAILKAGGTYVPLDPEYPSERLADMLEVARPLVVLADEGLADLLPFPAARILALKTGADDLSGEKSVEDLPERIGASNLAYVLFTSGSTGRPKGVAVPHRAIARLVFGTNYVRLEPHDRVGQASNVSFDAATFEIWGALLHGASLAAVPKEIALSAQDFGVHLRRQGITTLFLTTSLFQQLAGLDPSLFAPLDHLLFGGEAVDPEPVRQVLLHGAPRRLLHVYGPTESTTFSSWHRFDSVGAGARTIPIGRPLANTSIRLLDRWLQPSPAGAVGEIAIGGDGLARGYLGTPHLTAERFIPDPCGRPGERLYRTGDLGRFQPDGAIEFLGRLDRQVKIRGFRIEPGEVEAVLRSHLAVRQVLVDLRRDAAGDRRLVAYVVPRAGTTLDATTLRSHARLSLPEWMLPAAFVLLAEIPLTPNGKVDRAALPAPVADDSPQATKSAPRGAIEEILAGVFGELLGLAGQNVSRDQDFFALGGHSLLATRLISRVRQLFDVELPLRTLFEAPTVAEMAAAVAAATALEEGLAAPPLKPQGRREALLSFAQERLWFLDQIEPGRPLYNVPLAMRLRGRLSVACLAAALTEILHRHAALRTYFISLPGRSIQVIEEAIELSLPAIDLRALPDRQREAEARRQVREEARRPFDLGRGPLARAVLFQLGEQEHAVAWTMHHIASDGWSLGVFVRELAALYQCFSTGRPTSLPELAIQYTDFADWQRRWLSGAALDHQLSYWRQRLAGAPPLLDLPTDRPRPVVETTRGASESATFASVSALRAFGGREGVTLFMTLLAVFQVLLHRYTAQDDLVVGTPIAGRNRAELEDLIGFFVNSLVLRTDLSGDPSFRALLGRVRETALGAYTYQDAPFEKLVEELGAGRDLGRTPLFQVMFALQNAPLPPLSLGGLELAPIEIPRQDSEFDLGLATVEVGEGLAMTLVYRTELFDRVRIQRMGEQLAVLLEEVTANPDRSLAALPLFAPAARHQLLVEWNAAAADLPAVGLHELFEGWAARRPELPAVLSRDRTVSYGELDQWADQLARELRHLGVGPEIPVGLCATASPARIAGLLAILKAGGAYVPLEPDQPAQRLRQIFADCGVPAVLADDGLPIEAVPPSARVVRLAPPGVYEAGDAPGRKRRAGPGNLAYVIYTSGSTGAPKGVAVSHRSAVNLVVAARARFAPGTDSRVSQLASFGFDAAVLEVFLALSSGAALGVAEGEQRLSAPQLNAFLRQHAVSHLVITPTLLGLVSAGELPDLRTLIVGGEVCPAELMARWAAHSAFFNCYGPTETTIFSTLLACSPDLPGRPPIGRPVANTAAYVLSPSCGLVPPGAPGELCLGGEGLARGYLGRPDLTAARFVPHPFAGATPGSRLYRTGDLVRELADGTLEYLGRTDDQVKVRGFRIEPGEIETLLLEHPRVREAVVVVAGEDPAERRLVAFVVPSQPGDGGPGASLEHELREHLRARLPNYMVPSSFLALSSLPATAPGKLDRRSLAELAARSAPEGRPRDVALPRSPTEELVAEVWAEVLGSSRFGVHDSFFELGGHSLLATQVVSRLRDVFAVELPLRTLFEAPTVAALSFEITAAQREMEGGVPLAPLTPSAEPHTEAPLSFAQQRLWFLHQLDPEIPCNMPSALELGGRLETAALRGALEEIVRRHESLRTRFEERGGQPVQVFSPAGELALPVVDLTGLPRHLARALYASQAACEARRPFDLGSGPLLRAILLWLDPESSVLWLNLHHIISDGWSMTILYRELAALYEAFATGRPSPLPPLPAQYSDFAVWQRQWLTKEALAPQFAYWRRQLEGAPPSLDLPWDRPRTGRGAFRGALRSFDLDAGLAAGLSGLAQSCGATLSMVLLAAFKSLLLRTSGQDDVAVGMAIAGRNRREIENLIGFFVNALVLRTRLDAGLGFGSAVERVRETALGAYSHQDLPFELLVEDLQPERQWNRNPLIQVMYVFQKFPGAAPRVADLTVSRGSLETADTGSSKFDLTLSLAEHDQGIQVIFEHSQDLFDDSTIHRLAAHLTVLLESAAAAPSVPLGVVALLSRAERHQLENEWNGASSALAPAETRGLYELFDRQARLRWNETAVICGLAQLSYGELFVQANQLAHRLRDLGVGPERRVGLCLERSLELVVGILAILKAGGAYVPLDPGYPRQRLDLMIKDAGLDVLVATTQTSAGLAAIPPQTVLLDVEGEALARWPESPPDLRTDGLSCAYVIYTSGSTGRPKGVAVSHANVVRLLLETAPWFDFGPHDVWTMFHSYAFDFSVWELWGALAFGGRIVVVPLDVARSPEDFYRLLCHEGVTVLNQTPAAFRQLMVEEEQAGAPGDLALRWVIFGGESLTPQSLAGWLERHGDHPRLVNMYGITETTVHVTARFLTRDDLPAALGSPIGHPIPDLQVHLLDRRGHLVPAGVAGEIHVGGAGVARGYLHRPDLTAERFVPNPFPDRPGDRLYRTGDLGRRRFDGQLEHLGRIDDQVKIRGFRIELGEIEALLGRHPVVRQALVQAREDVPGDRRLVAYVVEAPAGAGAGDDLSRRELFARTVVPELRRHLATQLPEYMIPAAFVRLEELPLSPHGKVDRRRLPAPDPTRIDLAEAFVAPRTETEAKLAAIWSQLLGIERISAEDDFFALGGHSLLATQVTSRIREEMKLEVTLRDLFEAPILAGLARLVDGLIRAGGEAFPGPPLEPVPRGGLLPLSYAQERLWLLERLDLQIPLYNEAAAFRLTGRLDVAALRWSLSEVVRRHEILRTVFPEVAGRPQQSILPAVTFELPLLDLSAVPAAEELARRLGAAQARRPFDLVRGPLERGLLARLAAQEHVVLLSFHHIVFDGWSMEVLVRELSALYGSRVADLPTALPPLPLQYADYAVWQRRWLEAEGGLEAQVAYWRDRLAGAPLLDLPTDRPRGVSTGEWAGETSVWFDAATVAELRSLGRSAGATLFMVLLAAFQTLLCRYSGQEDLVVGSPVANRNRSRIEGLIGFFVNLLMLRGDLAGDPLFGTVLEQARETALSAYAHQDLPFEKVVEALQPDRDVHRNPFFRVALQVLNTPDAAFRLPGLTVTPIALDSAAPKAELNLAGVEQDAGLLLRLEYDAALFDRSTVERLLGHLRSLTQPAAGRSRRQRISELSLLSPPERLQVLDEWNDTAAASPGVLFPQAVAARAGQAPARVAAAGLGQHLSYGELEARADRLARRLRRLGVGPETRVGLLAERGLELAVSLLAILKSGGVYVPLDPDIPAARRTLLLTHAGVEVLIAGGALAQELAGLDLPVLVPGGEEAIAAPAAGSSRGGDPEADHLAYVIFTSGSTGTPKSVALTHRGLANLVAALRHRFDLGPDDRVLQFSALSFDASVWEFAMAWGAGATLCLAERSALLPGLALEGTLGADGITAVTLPPSLLAALDSRSPLPALRTLVVAGEACPPDLAERWSAARSFFNAYGPTETTVCATVGRYVPGSRQPTIGRPILNARSHLLDRRLQPVAAGVPGELCVSGPGLARGYLGRPGETAAQFVPDPLSGAPGARLYRTGDLARHLADGTIEFLGRIDEQVKVRGLRIEPGEIEAVLADHPWVAEAAVVAVGDAGTTKRLVAFVVPGRDAEPGAAAGSAATFLREFLATRLPAAMVPAGFQVLEALPHTVTGKVDRHALRQLETPVEPLRSAAYEPPHTPREALLAAIWTEILGDRRTGGRVGIHDNFFDLGGDSILSIQVAALAARQGCRITPRQLFEHQTIARLAAVAGTVDTAPAVPEAVTGPVPLTPIQRWFLDREPVEPHHFNQALLLRPERPIPPAVWERAVAALLLHHDALRLRFTRQGDRWSQQVADPLSAAPFTRVDLSRLGAAALPALSRSAGRVQASLNLQSGPLVRAVLYQLGGEETRLLLVAHHLAVDALSWRVLLADLEAACLQAGRGEPIALPPPAPSFALWAKRLADHASGLDIEPELSWWSGMGGGAALPVDHPGGSSLCAAERSVTIRLSAGETAALLETVAPALRARFHELLLTALALTLEEWTGEPALVDVEGHGREELGDGLDLSRTVGWFTSLFPLRFELGGTAPAAALRAVKERVRALPGNGLRYGLLRYLRDDTAARLRQLSPPEISFNYLGQFEGAGGAGRLALADEEVGALQSPRARRSHLLGVSALVAGGQLRVDWAYSATLHERSTIECLAAAFATHLRRLHQLVASAAAQDAYGPSDFPLAGLAAPALARLVAALPGIEDAYPLTPLQEGILFHTLGAPGSGVYTCQVSATLHGALDAGAFTAAWERVVDAHPILRTSFHWRGLDRPLQAVQAHVPVAPATEDWRALSREEQARRFDSLLQADWERGFDLTRAPLLRWTLLRTGEQEHRFVWTHHHILLDGWSYATVVRDFLAAYAALREGGEPQLSRRPAYRDHLSWLAARDLARSESFWQRALAGFQAPAPRLASPRPTSGPREWGSLEARLDGAETARLEAWARRHHLTLATLLQAAWGLLLATWSGERSVVFGTTVSGRSTELPGVESMVGLLINTLPLRLDVEAALGCQLLSWLESLQRHHLELKLHEHSSLVQIQGWSAVPRGLPLFETLLIVENYPRGELLLGGLEVDQVRAAERMSYPLTVYGVPGEELALRLDFDRHRLAEETLAPMLRDLRGLLGGMADDGPRDTSRTVSDLLAASGLHRTPVGTPWRSAPADLPPAGEPRPYTPPRTALEEKLACLWGQVLGLERIGVHDGFFDLGGHSLLARLLASRVEDALGVGAVLPILLQARDIENLAALIESLPASQLAS